MIIEDGAFAGLTKLRHLSLNEMNLTTLNLTGATLDALVTPPPIPVCGPFGCGYFPQPPALAVGSDQIKELILDDATLSLDSFGEIVNRTFRSVETASLVGLSFSDGLPADLDELLSSLNLDNVWVDLALYNLYADEFEAFAAIAGKTVTVVPLPAIIPGDFNNDGVVNAADFTVLRDSLGNGEFTVTSYNTWKQNFGATLESGNSNDVNVPEPSACTLLIITGACIAVIGRRIATE